MARPSVSTGRRASSPSSTEKKRGPYVPTIEYTTEGHRAVITINRPEARNAVNEAVANGIEEAIDRLEADDDLWVGILTGVPPVFSAGADLKEINAGRAATLQTARGGFGGITRRKRT